MRAEGFRVGDPVRAVARPEWDASVYRGRYGVVTDGPFSVAGAVWVRLDHLDGGQRNPLAFQAEALEWIPF